MMKCPNCGYTNQDRTCCVICGQDLNTTYHIQNNEPQNNYNTPQTTTNTYNSYENPKYNNQNQEDNDYYPEYNDTNNYYDDNSQEQYTQPKYTHKKSKALIFILTLILPGFGQIYLGDILKGIILFVLCYVLRISSNLFLLLLWFILYIYTMQDALVKVDRYNENVK
ncbi:TM2 domain-containing protein [Methanosphaera sp. WGK6]|uniref:TM2 domain-containing protein n=1 Tax=Methanosphaera sp. WGK6 TaxID=1561964 RepID=UPI00086B5FCB|nr:TM2 domain-containing protein [Methanosphaera sp. WGK6]OED29519.1 hypothetical protein NL43_07790 [Methanosphaera sp. WGK6]